LCMEKYRFTDDQQSLMERMTIPFAVFQLIDKRIVPLALSDGFCELLGIGDRDSAYAAMNRDTYQNVHPDDAPRIADDVYRFVRDEDRFDAIYRLKDGDRGGYNVVHAFGRHVHMPTGERLGQIWYANEGPYTGDAAQPGEGLAQSLSSVLHRDSMLNASYYDYLTGLPSMTYFFELAELGKEAMLKQGEKPVLLYMDFSGMKYYNQKYSFAEGNKLLQAFGRTLARTFGNESCCHISGDHFAAYTREEGLEDALDGLFEACKGLNGGNALPVRVGIYPASMEEVPVSTACDRAKLACDALGKTFISSFNWYNADLRDELEKQQYILGNLDRAIREGWIQVYYQPIVRSVTQRVCDEEALARWIDPVNGFMSPADFIPHLEKAGLIYKLDLYMLERVLDKMRRQQQMGGEVVPHSINLSRSDFDACDIVEEIRKRVDAAGVAHDRITIEITESVVGSDMDFMAGQVDRFRKLGFPVWMDDFGSGYSSLDVLQSIPFDLIKFDMSFMQKLDEGDSGKIILTELMKLATSLGVDTVCEGVETKAQVDFLQEIGCSKLQGYYFDKPIPMEKVFEKFEKGFRFGYENPAESAYYEAIGRVNLYDLAVISNEEENAFQKFFNTLPMGILEIRGDQVHFIRTNKSYREFIRRFFNLELTAKPEDYHATPFGPGSAFMKLVQDCCKSGGRAFFDEQMPDGSVIHAFARKISVNPVTGTAAAAVAVLSISEPNDGATYAEIARALAADYYNIYVVDLDTERFIEYTSPVGVEELAMERHGENFFAAVQRDTMTRIYEEDREPFLAGFSKEKLIRELDAQGVYTATYRLIDTGTPMYVSMKITRMHPNGNRIIMGISIIDAQMRQSEHIRQIQRERDTLSRVMALSEDYLSLYMIDPETGSYVEYSASDEYERLGLAKEGEDFFLRGIEDGKRNVYPADLSTYLARFTRENVMHAIQQEGAFKLQYRLVIGGEPRAVSLRIAPFRDGGEEKLVAGVRAWRRRR